MTHNVIIIGAGFSGLSAAHTLCCDFKYKVLMLEARDRIGGCTDTFRTQTNYPVDMGMKFIDTAQNNANPNLLFALTKQMNIKTMNIDPNQSITYNSVGDPENLLDNIKVVEKIKATTMLIEEVKTTLGEKIKEHPEQHLPSLAHVLHYPNNQFPKPETPEFIVRESITAMITHHTGAPIQDVSVLELLKNNQVVHKNALIEGGMQQLIDALYQKTMQSQNLTVELNMPVSEIHHDPEDALPYAVTTNHKTFKAETIICTVPLGVLKEGNIQFYPPLSQDKQDAIQHLKPSLENTVVLEFKKPFWPKVPYIYIRNGEIHEYLNLDFLSKGKTATLVCHYYGEAAQFKNKTHKQIIEDALLPLKHVFKDKFQDPIQTHISRWDKDQYARGMGCYCTKASSALDLEKIRTPESYGLYFAGKHTEKQYLSTLPLGIYDAHQSGVRVALEIDAYLKNNQELSRIARRRFH